MQTEFTGWRPAVPKAPPRALPEKIDAKALYAAARDAVRGLQLRPAQRHVLDQLIGCWGGEPIQERLLVWPSNEFLMDRTGLSERALRYAIAGLIREGVIGSKDSANGKRFAIRSKAGQITDAFGLDLSPLLARREEYGRLVEDLEVARDHRRRQFDEITICRRSVQETLRALEELTPIADLEREVARLMSATPRRDSLARPEASLAAWRNLLEVTEARYHSACGGKSSRLIENNNDTPDQSCNKGPRRNEGSTPLPSLPEVAAACPDAMNYMGSVDGEQDLVRGAARLRGAFGAHESAWHEACEKLGPHGAARAFVLVLQEYELDGGVRIKNFGGYFRSYVRIAATGQVDLASEFQRMRRRRAH